MRDSFVQKVFKYSYFLYEDPKNVLLIYVNFIKTSYQLMLKILIKLHLTTQIKFWTFNQDLDKKSLKSELSIDYLWKLETKHRLELKCT